MNTPTTQHNTTQHQHKTRQDINMKIKINLVGKSFEIQDAWDPTRAQKSFVLEAGLMIYDLRVTTPTRRRQQHHHNTGKATSTVHKKTRSVNHFALCRHREQITPPHPPPPHPR
jgi:hypothetical protein